MRFLLDENISPKVADVLRPAGHDVTVAREVGLQRASDEVVIATARLERPGTAKSRNRGVCAHGRLPDGAGDVDALVVGVAVAWTAVMAEQDAALYTAALVAR